MVMTYAVVYKVGETVLFVVSGTSCPPYPVEGQSVDLPGHLLKCVKVVHEPVLGRIKIYLDKE